MTRATLRPAREADREAVAALLAEASLPTDLESDWFPALAVVAERGARVVGAAAFKRAGDAALLRSIVVAPGSRAAGTGAALVADRLAAARAAGMRRAFLLTLDAAPWFARLGFRAVARDAVPDAVAATREFASLCPASAACLARDLADG